MMRPDDDEERAFLLPEPFEDPDEPAVVVLADELAAAAESRRGWELPVDHASLLQAVRDVRTGGRMHGGVYWTAAEERDDQAVHDLPEHVDAALAPFTPRLAGTRWRWEGTKRIYEVGVVGDPTPLREAVSRVRFAERVRVVCRTVSEEALEALGEDVWAASDELEALGIVLQGGGPNTEAGTYDLMVVGPDEARGGAALQSRFGERLRVDWIAAGTSESQPRAFATWTAEDRSLTVHSWHDYNGEQPGSCTVAQYTDRVEVELRVLVPTGFTTLIGGWQPIRETIELDEPLGSRAVVDRTGGVSRPSWDELRGQEAQPAPDGAAAFAKLVAALPRGRRIVRDVVRVWGHPVLGALAAGLRPRLSEPAVLALLEFVLDGNDDAARRAVLVYVVEDTLLNGSERGRRQLRSASGPATRAAIAATDRIIRGPS
jgi:hypothetical protein